MPHNQTRQNILTCSGRILLFLLLLLAFGCEQKPRTETSTETPVSKEAFTKIDVHSHYYHSRDYLPPLLEDWRIKAFLLNGGPAETNPDRPRWKGLLKLHDRHPDRFYLCTSFNSRNIDEPNFARNVIEQLKNDIHQGARAVKVWKEIGMIIRDESGEFIQIDDPRYKPIWDFLAERDIPVIAHIGEPRAAWQPLDKESPHYGYYKNHPEYHAYKHPEIPDWSRIIAARDRWIEQNPDLTIVGAHLGSMAHDVKLIEDRLKRYDNFYVETAARFKDLYNQPDDRVRSFFTSYPDRILYGTDLAITSPPSKDEGNKEPNQTWVHEQIAKHWRYLTDTLNLPRPVLKKFYRDNARRVFDLEK